MQIQMQKLMKMQIKKQLQIQIQIQIQIHNNGKHRRGAQKSRGSRQPNDEFGCFYLSQISPHPHVSYVFEVFIFEAVIPIVYFVIDNICSKGRTALFI